MIKSEKVWKSEIMKRDLDEIDRKIEITRDAAAGDATQMQEKESIKGHVKPLEEFGVQKASETLARAGVFAWEREKARNLPKPLFIAPENLWGTHYGADPQELKQIITKSREEMARVLERDKGMEADEAKNIARDHIKATMDIGHANIWRKYFKGSDAEFKQWLTGQIDELTKEGIIGHVHTSDNFGFEDEHLTAGQGTAPLKELFETLDKHKFSGKIITEAGGQPEGRAWEVHPETWRMLGTPIYRIGTMQRSWGDIEGSYFGRTYAHSSVGGDYLPSKDWQAWSETPFE